VKIHGVRVGNIGLLIDSQDELLIGLGSLLDLVRPWIQPEQFGRLRSSPNARGYVSIDELRAAGFSIQFDNASESLVLSAN
jgi:hypothetical protein